MGECNRVKISIFYFFRVFGAGGWYQNIKIFHRRPIDTNMILLRILLKVFGQTEKLGGSNHM